MAMYTLARRSLSPLCQIVKKRLRHHIRQLEGHSVIDAAAT
jgi:DNA-binding protein Fis